MKKIVSLFLAMLMLFSITTVAFANTGTYQEELSNANVRVYCTNADCVGTCTGKFGCNCCESCPGYIDPADGVPANIGEYLDCAFGYYYNVPIYLVDENGECIKDENGNFVTDPNQPDGDDFFTMRYYWKAACCGECTRKKGCKCNNQDYKKPCGCSCCYYEPDHTAEQIQEGLDSGREGFTQGIQSALLTIRNVMYDLFDKLFKFLRLEDLLGKTPSQKT